MACHARSQKSGDSKGKGRLTWAADLSRSGAIIIGHITVGLVNLIVTLNILGMFDFLWYNYFFV
jgi:hypothetical protein